MSIKSYAGALIHPTYGDEVLKKFGLDQSRLLGQGRHSRVYEIDRANVLRIYPQSVSFKYVESLSDFYKSVDASFVNFKVPKVDEFGMHNDYIFSIERHLGSSMGAALEVADSRYVKRLVDEYVKVIGQVQDLKFPNNGYFGELMGDNPIKSSSWGEYLSKRALSKLNGPTTDRLRVKIDNFDELLTKWKDSILSIENPSQSVVHGDIFPGNLMVTDECDLSAVIDFSPMTLIGDKRLDVVTALVQIVFSHFRQEDMSVVNEKIRASFPIDENIFELYEIYIYLYYSSDPRDLMRDWCYSNLERISTGNLEWS